MQIGFDPVRRLLDDLEVNYPLCISDFRLASATPYSGFLMLLEVT